MLFPPKPSLPKETEAQKSARMKWWTDARFGMFIHWGLYALPARHEWVKNRERMTNEQYQKYFELFQPDLYNPKEWAKMAKAAGMKYVVLTAKHHEGFCLWDSKVTDYKATNTPIGKDLIKEYVEAFRAEGLKVGFYYSLIDWHHPDYTIDRNHPQRTESDAAYEKLNAGKDMAKYREYMKNQVRELLTNYGEISIIWFDFSFPGRTARAAPTGIPRTSSSWPGRSSRGSSSTTASTSRMSREDGTSPRPNRSRWPNGPRRTAKGSRGRPARRSPARGDTIATKHPGRARPSSSSC